MSQVDNRNSTAGKRARTDGGRREDDWTCPSCGNVNFSFRTTCNMRNCNQSRPAEHNSKPMIQRPLGLILTPPRYMGSMYGPPPPYGSSLYNSGPAVPPPVPFDHHRHHHMPPSPYPPPPYGYTSRFSSSLGSPYSAAPHHLPYTASSIFGSGGMYGTSPLAERYGLSLHVNHGAMGARPAPYLEENSHKKNAGEGRENDWKCPTCGNVNFSFRTVCNMRKCNTPRPENVGLNSENSKGSKPQPKTPEGSWKCEKCDNINYPFRTKCNRQNCGAERQIDASSNPNPNSNSLSPDQ